MAGEINPEWAGGHGGGEETVAIMAIDPKLIKYEYLEVPEGIRNDVSEELPYDACEAINVHLWRKRHFAPIAKCIVTSRRCGKK